MSMKTYQPKPNSIPRKWHKIDAQGQILGRLATEVSLLLAGKGKATYAPHADVGDFVVVLNAAEIKITGNSKPRQKMDFRHSGWLGGTTFTPYERFLKDKPDRAVQLAVMGMLPKNKLRARRMVRLKIYKGTDHPHGAQFAPPKQHKSEKPTAPASEEAK